MSTPFAKLFDSPRYGQLLVKQDADEHGNPELRVYFSPPDMGVCSIALQFEDDDAGHACADEGFLNMTVEQAEGLVSAALPPDMQAKIRLRELS